MRPVARYKASGDFTSVGTKMSLTMRKDMHAIANVKMPIGVPMIIIMMLTELIMS